MMGLFAETGSHWQREEMMREWAMTGERHPETDAGNTLREALERLLPLVRRPSRYGGNECNVIRKDWQQAKARLALLFPDLYEIGMSHQGLQILYQRVNREDSFLAERAYVPDVDLEELLGREGLPLFSLESKRPLAYFDILGITLPYELCYTNILTILHLAGLPFRSEDRDGRYPLVIGGGPCAFHPEPVADFFDAFLLGDGEEAIIEILRVVSEQKAATCSGTWGGCSTAVKSSPWVFQWSMAG